VREGRRDLSHFQITTEEDGELTETAQVETRGYTPSTTAAPSGAAAGGAGAERKESTMQLTVFEPVPLADDLPCRSSDPELFFAESPADVEFAKSVCTECPIREACLSGALERKEPWGVWGGELFVQGVIVARKRPRGRPRKTDIAIAAAA
jgi:WhiB family transcriptional regulator, redox-sensing transcriptional regulator